MNQKLTNINYWKQYDIVHFHRTIGQDYDNSVNLIQRLNSIGIVTIMDLDDYWLPTVDHPIHSIIVQNKIDEKIKANLKSCFICYNNHRYICK